MLSLLSLTFVSVVANRELHTHASKIVPLAPSGLAHLLPFARGGLLSSEGSVRKLIVALAVGANRPFGALPGGKSGRQAVAPVRAGRGRWFARSPQMHTASVHPLGGGAT